MSTYRKDYLLGEGGMGQVYRATRIMAYGDERPIACKVMRRKFVTKPEAIERFHQEAALTMDLDHDHVVCVQDYVAGDDGELCLIMELVEGVSVAELVDATCTDTPLPFDMVRVIAADVLDALDYVHGCNVLHRDISSENMLVCRTGAIKVADFGVAKALSPDSRQSGNHIGKLAYMAPEIRKGAPVDGCSDLFSFAATMYELLTGSPPFGLTMPELEIRRQRCEVAPLPDSVPDDLRALVMGLLRKDPADRCAQTAREARAMLRIPEDRDAIATQLGAMSTRLYADKCQRAEQDMQAVHSEAKMLKARPVVDGEAMADTRRGHSAERAYDYERTTLSTGGVSDSDWNSRGDDSDTIDRRILANSRRRSGFRSRLVIALAAVATIVLIVTWGSGERSADHREISPASKIAPEASKNAPEDTERSSKLAIHEQKESMPIATQPPSKPRGLAATRSPSTRPSPADKLSVVPSTRRHESEWADEWSYVR